MHERDRAQVLSDLHVTSKASPGTGSKGRVRATVTRRLRTIAGFYKYTVEEELLEHSPLPSTRSIMAVSGGSAGLRPDERRPPKAGERVEGERPNGPGPGSRAPPMASHRQSLARLLDLVNGGLLKMITWVPSLARVPSALLACTVAQAWWQFGRGRGCLGCGDAGTTSNKTPPAAAAAERSGSRSRTPRRPLPAGGRGRDGGPAVAAACQPEPYPGADRAADHVPGVGGRRFCAGRRVYR
jgi:hypothetical protein